MNFRRARLQQLAIILSVTIFFCVYLISWDIIFLLTKYPEDKTHSPIKLSLQVDKNLNIVRYVSNGSSLEAPSERQQALLSDDTRIYFHETTGRDHLNLRQLCAVESAAKKNPDRSVQIFFQTNHVNLTVSPLSSILKSYPNTVVILINVKEYFAGTVW